MGFQKLPSLLLLLLIDTWWFFNRGASVFDGIS